MSDVLDRTISILLGIAALAIAGAAIHREFTAGPSADDMVRASLRPVFNKSWRDAAKVGIRASGDSAAKIQVVEFVDYQCPVCRRADGSLAHVEAEFPGMVSRVAVQFPLDMHPYARPAARAAECAREQGRFRAMEQTLFAQQDSLGRRPWSRYGDDAGIRDTAEFARCAADSTPIPAVDAGLAVGQKFNVTGTPTIIVNGWQFIGLPPDSVLESTIRDLLNGKRPRSAG